jgi:hypothetical protein
MAHLESDMLSCGILKSLEPTDTVRELEPEEQQWYSTRYRDDTDTLCQSMLS